MKQRWILVLLAVALIAAACGRDSDSDDEAGGGGDATTTTAAPPTDDGDPGGVDGEADADPSAGDDDGAGDDTPEPDDPCDGVSLEATEIGVTADTISVLVMADVGSPLAPGLFQGSIDGVEAWAESVNAEGGLACRQVEVIDFDSQINPQESTNGILRACENALAMVGSMALFLTDVTDLDSCPDQAGEPTGIPDVPGAAVDAQHQCSPNVFTLSTINGSCPYGGEGPRDWVATVGAYLYLQDQLGPLNGIMLMPGDLRATLATVMPNVKAQQDAGWTLDGIFPVSGSADQATYAQYVQAMLANGSNFAQSGSNDQSVLKLRREAIAQGLDVDTVSWFCTAACFTPEFVSAEPEATEGTYVWLPYLPFGETDANPELADFIEAIGDPLPQSWAGAAWASGVLFEEAVNRVVAADGPNALTRARLLAALATIEDYDANGMYGTITPAAKEASNCFVLLQVQGGEFVRVHPAEPGTFDCDERNTAVIEGYDSLADFDSR